MSAVDYIAKHSFVWWQGVVEDILDPMKLGRVRVRVIGYHNPDKADFPTEDLPWAIPIMPVTSASTSGIGYSSTGLVPGSVVIGFFRDGELAQQPIIFGSIMGAPLNGPPGVSFGYGDPRLVAGSQGTYVPNAEFLGKGTTKGKYAPRSGHYVGLTYDPQGRRGRNLGQGKPSLGGLARYNYDWYKKGITHTNSDFGNIYPRYWGGPTGTISPITDTNTLAGGCGPTHGSKIIQEYIIDRSSIGNVLPVPKFRPYCEIPLITYDVGNAIALNGVPGFNGGMGFGGNWEAAVGKLDLGAGGGFRVGTDLFGKYGGLPEPVDEDGNIITPNSYNGYETTTSLRGNEYFERIFGATSNYIKITRDRRGRRVETVDETNPWIFMPPKGTTNTRQYPYNRVFESESGHIMEFDDTNGGERVKIGHRLGTFEEIIEDGSKIEQVVNEKYTKILGDNNTVVGGNSIFFGERGFRAIINAEAIYYPVSRQGRNGGITGEAGRPTPFNPGGVVDQGVTRGDPFIYGPGFLGTGERGGPGWYDPTKGRNQAERDSRKPQDGSRTIQESEFFIDPTKEKNIFSGNYQVNIPQGVKLDRNQKFHSGYRGLKRMNFFKGGNTDIIVAYGNVNLHVMRGNANLRLDEGDMNLELLNGDLRSYISGNHFQRIDGNEIRFIGGNKYDIINGKKKDISANNEVTTRGAINLFNEYVSLDFTLRQFGADSPISGPGGDSNSPVQGSNRFGPGGSDQEFRGMQNLQNFGLPGGANSGQGTIVGGG